MVCGFFPSFLPFLPSLGEFFSLLRKMCWQSLPVQLPHFSHFLAVHIFRIKKESSSKIKTQAKPPLHTHLAVLPKWVVCQTLEVFTAKHWMKGFKKRPIAHLQVRDGYHPSSYLEKWEIWLHKAPLHSLLSQMATQGSFVCFSTELFGGIIPHLAHNSSPFLAMVPLLWNSPG